MMKSSDLYLHHQHFSVSQQRCSGPHQPLRKEDGVGGHPAHPFAPPAQAPRSRRHQAGSSCGRGKLVRTGKHPVPAVQEEHAAPPGQKTVSESPPADRSHRRASVKSPVSFSQESSELDPDTRADGQRQASGSDELVGSARV